MNTKISFLLLLLLSLQGCAQNNRAIEIYNNATDAIVKVYAQAAYSRRGNESQGSAVILKDKGWLITNAHVMGGNGGRNFYADHNGQDIALDKVLLRSEEFDIMVVELNKDSLQKNKNKIPQIELFNSDNIKIGQQIYAIASPLGLENSITEGIVSGIRKSDDSEEALIQISAPVSPGSSGGAVLDDKGRLIAIICSQASGDNAQNVNFAIPINRVLKEVAKKRSDPVLTYDDCVKKGFDNFNAQDYAKAHHYFDAAISLFPPAMDKNYLYSLNYRAGLAAYRLEQNQEALTHFGQAWLCDSLKRDCYFFSGAIYTETRQYSKAQYYYQLILNDDPNFTLAYVALGKMYLQLNNIEDAQKNIQTALRLQPFNEMARYLSAKAAYKTGQYNNAEQILNEIIATNRTYAEAILLLSKVFTAKGDQTKAYELRQNAYDIKPELRYKQVD